MLNKIVFSPSEFSVDRNGTCAGYFWVVEWAELGGDIPEMVVDGSGLYGEQVAIFVIPMLDGGTWLRPLRGDILRTPESEPQVCDYYI